MRRWDLDLYQESKSYKNSSVMKEDTQDFFFLQAMG